MAPSQHGEGGEGDKLSPPFSPPPPLPVLLTPSPSPPGPSAPPHGPLSSRCQTLPVLAACQVYLAVAPVQPTLPLLSPTSLGLPPRHRRSALVACVDRENWPPSRITAVRVVLAVSAVPLFARSLATSVCFASVCVVMLLVTLSTFISP